MVLSENLSVLSQKGKETMDKIKVNCLLSMIAMRGGNESHVSTKSNVSKIEGNNKQCMDGTISTANDLKEQSNENETRVLKKFWLKLKESHKHVLQRNSSNRKNEASIIALKAGGISISNFFNAACK